MSRIWDGISARDRELVAAYIAGEPVKAIAGRLRLSQPRVRLLLVKYKPIRFVAVRPAPIRVAWCKRCRQSFTGSRTDHVRSLSHFWAFVDRRGDGCWEWVGGRHLAGYGHVNGSYAHRRVWELTHGPIPPGLFVLHGCDNPPCVRPDHLRLGSAADNAHDRDSRGRDRFSRAR